MSSSTIPRFEAAAFQQQHGVRGRHFTSGAVCDAEGVLRVMSDREFMVGPSNFPSADSHVLSHIEASIDAAVPIEVVLPSFAGRPHNPAAHRRVAPDLGEAYAIQLLSNISEAVGQVYPPGLVFTLILDGRAYRPFYGYSDDEGLPYADGLQHLISELGAARHIRLVDMHDLLVERKDELDAIDERVRSALTRQWNDPAFIHRDALVRALRQGTETTPISAALIELYKRGNLEGVDAQAFLQEASSITGERAEHTAFEYATLVTKLHELDLIGAAFPGAVRGTVHPKPGQYSPRIKDPATVINPWHGVAIETHDGRIVTRYEVQIYQDFERYEAVFIRGDDAPFFYREIAPE
ncbi:hypothetical protein C5C20_08410 [Rathayibacter rathayi]|uniref:Pyoverdine/dityrosine biosynthesis protein n=2 Tax=Rathayibacter rathayi TaxID=33887 RepID=A0ABD6W8E1_RATRA|nr:L-tyrosine/L-tryptophan isonitrile synthase family protein [Rathayibacter rathayi]PPF14060.1 hypothetical protein C5C04_08130 [Rathayibacter rathayi]PPG13206.1 hypothetical protein C5C11_07735 [Rathayibacter rathayi]PPG43465.1 hypothetical protein C5C20_08410 [Rathayibacter rathayi]PPH76362.1 hypothetical protein C5C40_09040 [Rathayibacter rathayi]PPI03390.1 hypothetical protein C5C43_07255 [Rathayibacter rathayi]